MPQFQRKVVFLKASLAWSALTGGTGGKGEVPAGKRCRGVTHKSVVRAIPMRMKQTPGATLGVRASFSDEDEKHPWEVEKHPGRAAGQLCCSSFDSLNPTFGKCMELPQIKYPGMWKVSVPFPLGCIGRASTCDNKDEVCRQSPWPSPG